MDRIHDHKINRLDELLPWNSVPLASLTGSKSQKLRYQWLGYIIGGVSGKQFDRPGLTALQDHTRPGESLAITRLDRFGRSLKELLETVENLKAQNIGLICVFQGDPAMDSGASGHPYFDTI